MSKFEDKILGAVKSRLMTLSLLLVVLGAVQAQIDVFTRFLTPVWQGVVTALLGVVVGVLRWTTTLPLDKR